MTDEQWIQLHKSLNEAMLEYPESSEIYQTFRKAKVYSEGILQRDFGWTDEEVADGKRDDQPRHGEG